jgi:hypothetical protein
VPTTEVTSPIGRMLLPALLALGLFGGLGAGVLRLMLERRR